VSSGPDPTPIGTLVGGKYRIVRLLARGGMGVVYEAQHTVVRRRFAIKFLRRDLAERRDILNRFQREAEAAGALENDHVTAAIDFSISDDGTPYIVMEYLVGESLAALLEREGRLSIGRAADLVLQACRGVGAAHAAGIVHRDLKPHNLFVCRRDDGTDFVKVLDFGVAKLQALDEASAATRTGVVLGTAAYMSPEQARGDKLVDKRADIYALGAILYELVSLKRPHPGDSQNAILHHIATQPPVSLASLQPDLPADFIEAVGRAVASDPAARPATVEALGDALAVFAQREVWPPPPTDSGGVRVGELSSTMQMEGGPAGGTPAVATVDDHAVHPAAPPSAGGAGRQVSASMSRPPRRRPRLWIGVSLTAAVAVFAVAAGLRRMGAPSQPALVPRSETARVVAPETRPLNAEPAPRAVPTPPTAASAPSSPSDTEPKARLDRAVVAGRAASADVHSGLSGRPGTKSVGRPSSHAARRSAGVASTNEVSNPPSAPVRGEKQGAAPPTFDPDNPYR
jgi:serine/threonine protein kinase